MAFLNVTREKAEFGMGGSWFAARVRPNAVARDERTWVMETLASDVGRAERRAPRLEPGEEG